MGEVDDYNRQIEEFNQQVDRDNAVLLRQANRRLVRGFLVNLGAVVSIAMLGTLFGWGWVHHQSEVMWFSAIGGLAMLVVFWAGLL